MNKRIALFLLKRNEIIKCGAMLMMIIIVVIGVFGVDKKVFADNYPEWRKSDEILVKYKSDDELYLVKISSEESIEEELIRYRKREDVDFAEYNYIYESALIPTDTFFDNQWYLKKIKAAKVWNEVRESRDIVIAVIDTGVQVDHSDLKENIWKNVDEIEGNGVDDDRNGFIDDIYGWDFVDGDLDPSPEFDGRFSSEGISHGTIVAGIAAAAGNNATGVSGVTWRARIMPLRILDGNGHGDTRAVIQAIDYAIANKANIINFSFVGFGYSRGLDLAIRRAYKAGIIMVAAAGNDKKGVGYSLDEKPMYPVCHDGDLGDNMIIGVAATDALDEKTSFSGYGTRCIDISAPGVSIFSTSAYERGNKEYSKKYDGYWSGTSMAVPMVSATLALIETVNPSLNRDEVVEVLLSSVDNIDRLNPEYEGKMGRGRLNVERAVIKARSLLQRSEDYLLIGPRSGAISRVGVVSNSGVVKKSFIAFADSDEYGVRLSAGDLNGDGEEEIVIGNGIGAKPIVRIFSNNGEFSKEFSVYNEYFRGGVNVSVGDVDGDGKDEIITGAGPGGGPHVRVFNFKGELVGQFFAYGQNFRGGVNVSVGDIDGDGIDEIVTGAGSGGGAHVRVFDYRGGLKNHFFAYSKDLRNGVSVALVNVNGLAKAPGLEVVTLEGEGGLPLLKIFDVDGVLKSSFFVHDMEYRGGFSLSSFDYDNDGFDEIVVGASTGERSVVKIFKSNGDELDVFYAFEESYEGGVIVSKINY